MKRSQNSRTWGGCSAVPSERWQDTPEMGQDKGWVEGCPWVWVEAGQHRVAKVMHRKVSWDTQCSWRAALLQPDQPQGPPACTVPLA